MDYVTCSHCKRQMPEIEYRAHIEMMSPQEIRAWFLHKGMGTVMNEIGNPMDYLTGRD